jgi:hypothetical protein
MSTRVEGATAHVLVTAHAPPSFGMDVTMYPPSSKLLISCIS